MALDNQPMEIAHDDAPPAEASSLFAPGAAGTSTLAGAMSIDLTDGIDDEILLGTYPGAATLAQTLSPGLNNILPISRTRETSLSAGDGSAASPFEIVDDNEDDEAFAQAAQAAVLEDIAEERDALEETHRLVPIQTGYVYDPHMMLHVHPGNGIGDGGDDDDDDDDSDSEGSKSPHPEAPERIMAIYDKLEKGGCIKAMKKIRIREATKEETMLVHLEEVWDSLERTQLFNPLEYLSLTRELESRHSLYINQQSALCARLSCGGVMEMCDAVASGRVRNGFAIVRPPGHHAEPDRAMGFCFYNNVAVAARFLQEKYGQVDGPTRCKRIMILDWDVHHGNGTQSAFWDNPDVLYVSVHRFEDGFFYPGGPAGNYDMVGGEGESRGRNVNIPWPTEGMGDAEYIAAFQRIVMPIAVEFAPDLVIVSAGFDAAAGDQLGRCFVTPAGYAHMTYLLASLASGRLVVALEGGYNLDAIAKSSLQVTRVLLGEPPIALAEEQTCDLHAEAVLMAVERAHSPYWKCMRRPDYRPRPQEDADLPKITLSELLAQHRRYSLAKMHGLIQVPMSGLTGEGAFGVRGSCLCSAELSDESSAQRAIVLCVHDFGNVRLHAPSYIPSDVATRKEEVMSIVDSSLSIIEWAQKGGMSVIDLSLLDAETPSDVHAAAITAATNRRRGYKAAADDAAQQHLDSLLHVWDNLVLLLPACAEGKKPNVVLVGVGSGCQALGSLVDKRPLEGIVTSIIQLPCYAQPPTMSKGEVRKWYYRRSRVFLPFVHKLFESEEDVATTTKRFGKIVRSKEEYSLRVFRSEMETITAFVEANLPAAAAAAAAAQVAPTFGANGVPAVQA